MQGGIEVGKLPVVIVTGFLGAGKTTFINEMLSYLKQQQKRTALLINEFGKINIDAELIEDNYAPIYEVNQGSIFCVCTRDQFISAMSAIIADQQNYEMVVIEATGIADPASLEEYLEMPSLAGKVDIAANFCIIDAANFHKVQETLPAATNQVKAASTCIINKIDLVESDYLPELEHRLRNLNEKAQLIKTSYGKVDFSDLLPEIERQWTSRTQLKKAPPKAAHAVTLKVEGVLDDERVQEFLEKMTDGLLRAKGFLKFKEGWHYIDWSGNVWEIRPADRGMSRKDNPSEIVLIGNKMDEKVLQTAFEDCVV